MTSHSLVRVKSILETYLPRTPELTAEAMRLRLEWEAKQGTGER